MRFVAHGISILFILVAAAVLSTLGAQPSKELEQAYIQCQVKVLRQPHKGSMYQPGFEMCDEVAAKRKKSLGDFLSKDTAERQKKIKDLMEKVK